MNERHLHEQVADYLDLALIPPTWWTTFPADGATRRGRIGLQLGVPDILIVHEGRAHWIELKRPGTKARFSDRQLETMVLLKMAGSRCAVTPVRTLEEVVIWLTTWDIPLRPIKVVA